MTPRHTLRPINHKETGTSNFTVLVRTDKDGKGWAVNRTFGTYRDDYLWNLAWGWERRNHPEGLLKRQWSLTRYMSDANIAQLKERGWSIRKARIELEDE